MCDPMLQVRYLVDTREVHTHSHSLFHRLPSDTSIKNGGRANEVELCTGMREVNNSC